MAETTPTLIAINAVLADRVGEFEEWLRSVVVPAMQDHQPHLDGQWRVLRATEATDGTVVFAFVCEGGTPEDWDLRRLLVTAFGEAAADSHLETFGEMLRGDQAAWFFTPMPLDRN
jgi:hypothetical protein